METQNEELINKINELKNKINKLNKIHSKLELQLENEINSIPVISGDGLLKIYNKNISEEYIINLLNKCNPSSVFLFL